MSDRPKFSQFDDDPTVVGAGLVHPSDPFGPPDTSEEATMVVDHPGPDMSSEATMVHDSLANPLAPLAKLHVEEGVQQGKEYPLLGAEISFGREKDNTISHPDLSVSRRHFKILFKNDKFFLEDLGGPNGTLHNRKKVSGTTVRLHHGDQIQAGKTLLKFLLLDESAAESRPAGNNMVAGVVVGFLVLAMVGGGAFFFLSPKNPKVTEPRDRTPPKARPKVTLAMKEISKGIEQKRLGQYAQAKRFFERAQRLAKPGSFERLQANQLLKDTIAEITVGNLVGQAEVKYQSKEYKAAQALVKRAEGTLPIDSPQAEKVWNLSFKVRLRLSGKNIGTELVRVRKMYRRRQYKQALALVGQLQRIVDPSSRDAQKLIKLSQKIYKRYRPRPRRRRRVAPVDRRSSGASTPTKQPDIRIEPVKPPPLSQGLLFFNQGNLAGAKTAFSKAGQASKAAQVNQFGSIWTKGRSAYAVRNPTLAIPTLRRAYELDINISGGKSVFSRQIRIMLGGMYYAKGRIAMARGNYRGFASAFTQFRQARKYYPRHSGSKRSIDQLRKLAQGWYTRAEKLGVKNPTGRRLLRNILSVVAGSDPLYQKAEKLLK